MLASSHCPICTKDTPHQHDRSRWIGVDFDGTLAYSIKNRKSPYSLGKPIFTMVNRVKDWISKGYTVKILTARMNKISSTGKPRNLDIMKSKLEAWCLKYIGTKLECTSSKDGFMEVLWDDRAVNIIEDTGEARIIKNYFDNISSFEDIEFRYLKVADGDILQFRKKLNGIWSSWTNIKQEEI